MINGAHVIINSKKPEADRAFLREVLGLPYVDVGHGWLIFGLPPAEVAVHPADASEEHQLYLMCEDVEALMRQMKEHNIDCAPVRDLGWGLLTQLSLPGGGKLGVYQPRHARPNATNTPKRSTKRAPVRRAAGNVRKPQAKKKAKR
jgi:hypothetical protein